MQVTVRYFAAHKAAAGVAEEVLQVADGMSVGELLEEVARLHPALRSLREDTLVSVNKGLGPADLRLNDGDDVVLFPPISGG